MFWLTTFAVSMGLLEAAVVVYLRELYYPGGFRVPVAPMPPRVALVELLREATTLLMLLSVAVLAGRSGLDRFFVFGFLFGLWDVVYYLGLKLFLGWPDSLWTWDILFLIPVPWVGPVIYPLLVSSLLVTGFLVHEGLARRELSLRPTRGEWISGGLGAGILVLSFCWQFRVVVDGTEPREFPHALFAVGLLLGTFPFIRAASRLLWKKRT